MPAPALTRPRIPGDDRPGPVSTRIRETFWRRRAEGWYATPVDYDAVP